MAFARHIALDPRAIGKHFLPSIKQAHLCRLFGKRLYHHLLRLLAGNQQENRAFIAAAGGILQGDGKGILIRRLHGGRYRIAARSVDRRAGVDLVPQIQREPAIPADDRVQRGRSDHDVCHHGQGRAAGIQIADDFHAFESVLKFRGINARHIAEMRIPTRKKDAIARLDARGNLLLDMVERAFRFLGEHAFPGNALLLDVFVAGKYQNAPRQKSQAAKHHQIDSFASAVPVLPHVILPRYGIYSHSS